MADFSRLKELLGMYPGHPVEREPPGVGDQILDVGRSAVEYMPPVAALRMLSGGGFFPEEEEEGEDLPPVPEGAARAVAQDGIETGAGGVVMDGTPDEAIIEGIEEGVRADDLLALGLEQEPTEFALPDPKDPSHARVGIGEGAQVQPYDPSKSSAHERLGVSPEKLSEVRQHGGGGAYRPPNEGGGSGRPSVSTSSLEHMGLAQQLQFEEGRARHAMRIAELNRPASLQSADAKAEMDAANREGYLRVVRALEQTEADAMEELRSLGAQFEAAEAEERPAISQRQAEIEEQLENDRVQARLDARGFGYDIPKR